MQELKCGQRRSYNIAGRAQHGFVTRDHATDDFFPPMVPFLCTCWQKGEEKRTCSFSVPAKLVDPLPDP
jgi:hypothetical protein